MYIGYNSQEVRTWTRLKLPLVHSCHGHSLYCQLRSMKTCGVGINVLENALCLRTFQREACCASFLSLVQLQPKKKGRRDKAEKGKIEGG